MIRRILLISRAVAMIIGLVALSSCETASTEDPALNVAVTSEIRGPEAKRYVKTIYNRIGRIWYALVSSNSDNIEVGTVETKSEIPVNGGKLRKCHVVSNTGNDMDATLALKAISAVRVPAVPPAALADLCRVDMELVCSFVIFPPSQ
jgi:hypothetical protein